MRDFIVMLVVCFLAFHLTGNVVEIGSDTSVITGSIGCWQPIDAFSVLLSMGGLDVSDSKFRQTGVLFFKKHVGPFSSAEVSEFKERRPILDMRRFKSGQVAKVVSTAETNTLTSAEAFLVVRQLKEMFSSQLRTSAFVESLAEKGEIVVRSFKPGLEGWNIEISAQVSAKGKTLYKLTLWRESGSKSERFEQPVTEVDI